MKSTTSEGLTHNPVEREVKLKADLDLALPDLRGVVAGTYRLPEQDLRAAYFDTPDFRLWSRGITLRHRLGEGPASGTWTLKLPEKPTGATLDRTELSWPGSRDETPAEAQRLLRGLVRSAELRQIAELNTVRRPLELHDKGGRSWAVMDDDTVTVSGGPRDGLRFRQVELELADDRPRRSVSRELDQVVKVLRKAGARHDGSPKLARALGMEAGPTPHAAPADVGTRSSLEEVIRHSINDGLDRLLDHDYRLRLSAYDPPAHDIHQARVATRRLRSDLRTFRPALDPVWVRHTRDELRWIGSALGNVRDVDVLTSGLSMEDDGSPTDAAGQRELLSHLSEQRRLASQQLAKVIEDDARYLRLLDRLHAAGNAPPFRARPSPGHSKKQKQSPLADSPARTALPHLVRGSWRALRQQVRRAGDRPTNVELHQVRIKAKQLRYASEAAAPVIGKRARRTAAAAKNLQTVLGDHHDSVAAEQWLLSEGLVGSPWASFTAGRLTGEQRRRQQKLRRQWRRVWKSLDRSKVRGWVD
jgi:CHAD domain-containing protein